MAKKIIKIKEYKKQIQIMKAISSELKALNMGMDGILEHALKIVYHDLGYEGASIFILVKGSHKLKMHKMVYRNEILLGEEEIELEEKNPLFQLYSGKCGVVYFSRPKPTYYFALRSGMEFIGIFRVDRWEKNKELSVIDIDILNTFVQELADAIFNVKLLSENQENLKMLQATRDISESIISSLRLEEMLDQVVKSMLENLGFDQVKLYLVDDSRKFLRGQIGGDVRGNIYGLSQEIYPLKKGVSSLVDIVLGEDHSEYWSKYNDIIYYLPLKIRGRATGLLSVDNLLSQQRITDMEKKTLFSIAGQIGVAIENARLFTDVEQLSITDSITKLYVFRYFKQRLLEELNRAERYGNYLSLIIMDIDKFKEINDTYGHQVGDSVLMEVSNMIIKSIRKIDFPARYGGDEFVVFLPHANRDIARFIVERIYQHVKSIEIEVSNDKKIKVEISLGVATFPDDAKNAEDLIKKADEALYWSKTHGRNRISFFYELANQAE